MENDFEKMGDDMDDDTMDNARPFLMGKAAAVVNERKSAKEIVDEMVSEAVQCLGQGKSMVVSSSSQSGGAGGVGARASKL